jgi:S1-C subfamily serine protease
MRLHSYVTAVLVLSVPGLAVPAAAQNARIYSIPRADVLRGDDPARAALGISVAGSTSSRDTLGLLVSAVTANGPAERAGIEEGDRIASINGVNLRLSPDDAGDFEASSAMSRRLTRELSRLRPGDDVDLRIYTGGRTRTVRVRTVDSDSLYGRRRLSRTDLEDRAALGFGVGSTGSRRDSLGVLVMFVDDSGPAGRAGIEEGNRIAEINGIDLRTGRDDSDDEFMGNSRVRRLQREIGRIRPGDDVDLRVYANGRYHDVKVRAARASELSHRHNFIFGGDAMGMNMFPGFDGALIGGQVRDAIERAMQGTGRALEGLGRGLNRSRVWQDRLDDDDPPRAERIEPVHVEPVHIEPLEPSRLRRTAPTRAPYGSALIRERTPSSDAVSATRMRDDASNSAAAVDIAGLRMVPVGAELASYLGKGSERGLLVIGVPGWARGAVRAGDVVLSVDGEPVRPDDGSDQVTVVLPRFRDVQLEILRDSVHHTITLPARH